MSIYLNVDISNQYYFHVIIIIKKYIVLKEKNFTNAYTVYDILLHSSFALSTLYKAKKCYR